ncbi:MAG: hypothetical protein GXO92_08740 [FCB group bacterium]|nr:hypothetical protein [FCB group bacterium]
MQTYRTIIPILLFCNITLGQNQNFAQVKLFAGWGHGAEEIPLDSIPGALFRLEYYHPDGKIKWIDFFDDHSKFITRYELVHDSKGTLLKLLVFDNKHKLKWYYFYDYDPIIMDWRITKYSPRGEWLKEKYWRELEADTMIDMRYFLIPLPVDTVQIDIKM